MTNKEFLNIMYKSVDTIPAYNFYKADEDIKYLLKDRTKELTEAQELMLYQKHNEFREWCALELHKEKYLNHINDTKKKIALESRINKIKTIKKIIELRKFDFVLIEDAFTEYEVKRLQKQLSECFTPYMPKIDSLLAIIDRAIKGANAELGMMAKEKEKEVNFNYVHEVVKMSRYLKMNLNPMELILSQFINYNKTIQEDAK